MNINRIQLLKLKAYRMHIKMPKHTQMLESFNYTAEATPIHSSIYMFIIIPYAIDIIAEIY